MKIVALLALGMFGLSGCATGALWNCYCGWVHPGTARERGRLDGIYADSLEDSTRFLVIYSFDGSLRAIEFDCTAPEGDEIVGHVSGIPGGETIHLRFEHELKAEGECRANHEPSIAKDRTLTCGERIAKTVRIYRSRFVNADYVYGSGILHDYEKISLSERVAVEYAHHVPYSANLLWVVPLTFVTVPLDIGTIPLQFWAWPAMPIFYTHLNLGPIL